MDVLKLRQVREDLLGEIQRLELDIKPLQLQLSKRRAQLESLDHMISMEEPQPPSASSLSAGASRGTVGDAAYELLASTRKPTHYSQLVEELSGSGVAIPGKDKGTNLIAHLSRDDRFARVGSGIYGLTEWGLKALPRRKRAKKARRK